MNKNEIENEIKKFIVYEFLDGKGMDIDDSTPLLQWGVIDSLSLVQLVGFLEKRFNVSIPPKELNAENFENLAAVGGLLVRLNPGES